MVAKKYHAKLFKNLSKLLTNKEFINGYITKDKYFTRNRKLSFRTVTLLILRLLKSSIKTELKTFYQSVFKTDEIVNWVSDAAFCKARQKIPYRLFIDLYKTIIHYYYSNIGGKRWFHYRLLAVDGSALNLPSSKELLERFGHHHSNSIGTKVPQARVSFLVDVLNNFTLDAQIESFKVGEQEMFLSHLACMDKTDLLTADANYGHFWILKSLLLEEISFCIRINQSTNLIKEFLASGKDDNVVLWEPSKRTIENTKKHNLDTKPIKVRLVRIELSCGKTEVLVLSLLDKGIYSLDSIKELYDMRWGVEEEIKKYMQRLMVEFFSSIKVNGVLQDFYANIFMLNIVTFLSDSVKDGIYQSSEDNKFRRQINWTSALGDVRRSFVLLFLRAEDKVRVILYSLWESFIKNTEAIRPDRKFPRDNRKKGSRQKAFMQYKPAW